MVKSLNDKKWKEFNITDILGFCNNSKAYHSENLVFSKKGIPYITRTNLNNGLYSTVQKDVKYKINPKFSISLGAENATYFVQPFEFITGNKMYYYTKEGLSLNTLKFLTICLNKSLANCGFGYGLGLTGSRSDKRKFMLPINSKGEPDYEFMEKYIIESETKRKIQYKEHVKNRVEKLQIRITTEKKWKDFFIEEIADIHSGRDIYERERVIGDTPYVTSTAQNNGTGYLVSNFNKTLEANCLSVNRNGSVGYCFYHPYNALYSNDCRKLKLKNNSKYIGLYISNVITCQKGKYGYGYKMGTGRLKRQKIMLPVTSKSEPDYEYMENYMKYLEQKKLLEYLDFIN